MAEPISLPGLRADSPAAALALYGISYLLGEEATVRWTPASGSAEVNTPCETIDDLCELLVGAVRRDPFHGLERIGKDINELTPAAWESNAKPGTALGRLVAGLCAEAPLRNGDRAALTPICVYSFGTRGTLFGNAAKQDEAFDVKALRAVLNGAWVAKKDVNTLGFDPGARRQDGAIMGPDPSADGVRGVPGLVPLVLRGLAAVAPMPWPSRVGGGAFRRENGTLQFLWPIFTAPTGAAALPALVARDWTQRNPAERVAASIDAVYAADILRAERRLSFGRPVA